MRKMIEWSKFEKLEKKYSKLSKKQKGIENKLKIFEKMPQAIINHKTKEGLYLSRIYGGKNGIIYLHNTKIRKNHCDVCGKRRKTTAHHLIPRRLKSINIELRNIRIRVCNECESKIHPENQYQESFMLKRKEREVKYLKLRLNKKVKDLRSIIIYIFDRRFEELKKGGKDFIPKLKAKGHLKKIHPALKQLNGRLKELRYLRSLVNKAITSYFQKYELTYQNNK